MSELPRGIQPSIEAALRSVPVVVLEGARAVGKTTLVNAVALAHGGDRIDLSDPYLRASFERDPEAILGSLRAPAVIDEAQLVPDVALSLKRVVDRRSAPGQFLVTGSARIGRTGLGGSDPLAGRAINYRLDTLTEGERRGNPVNLVAQLLSDAPVVGLAEATSRSDLIQRCLAGGLPSTVAGRSGRHDDQLAGLIEAYLAAAVNAGGGRWSADRSQLQRTAEYLFANPAQILNVSRAASDLGLGRDTVHRYLEVLDDTFLTHALRSERPNASKTVTSHPKLHALDTAIAAHCSRANEETPDRLPHLFGSLVESLVVHELLAQTQWTPRRPRLAYWREGMNEVDALLVDGRTTIPIEIKAATQVSGADAKGIRAYVNGHRSTTPFGVVFYSGEWRRPIEDGIWAVPISDLWSVRQPSGAPQ